MRFLLDQNISIKTAKFLRNFDIEVLHINETTLKGKSDTEIYEIAKV
ncbi:MAG: DUF5615 family PIN-like protein [archaeon]|nr:DUF5615 family PIN-like protein [archaeon]MCP8314237.1 DUF5615 family PIN-like protein [archaeon]MCP8315467.1 DUF5615 family PIN-like protein [archaeon]MCP8322303.1 DUF5615 family PIN-like protein [archaeon]